VQEQPLWQTGSQAPPDEALLGGAQLENGPKGDWASANVQALPPSFPLR